MLMKTKQRPTQGEHQKYIKNTKHIQNTVYHEKSA